MTGLWQYGEQDAFLFRVARRSTLFSQEALEAIGARGGFLTQEERQQVLAFLHEKGILFSSAGKELETNSSHSDSPILLLRDHFTRLPLEPAETVLQELEQQLETLLTS